MINYESIRLFGHELYYYIVLISNSLKRIFLLYIVRSIIRVLT